MVSNVAQPLNTLNLERIKDRNCPFYNTAQHNVFESKMKRDVAKSEMLK